jgi:hypothetical protein
MKRYLPSSTLAAVLLAGALFASATGGAVAGSLITGKQIKDGSVTGKDLKDKSVAASDLAADARVPGPAGPVGLTGPPGPSGVNTLQLVDKASALTNPNTPVSVLASCPAGQKATGGVGFWFASGVPAKFALTDNLGGGVASSTGVPGQDILISRVVCITATAAPPLGP